MILLHVLKNKNLIINMLKKYSKTKKSMWEHSKIRIIATN